MEFMNIVINNRQNESLNPPYPIFQRGNSILSFQMGKNLLIPFIKRNVSISTFSKGGKGDLETKSKPKRRIFYVTGLKLITCILLITIAVFITGCEKRVKKSQFHFGTITDITAIVKTSADQKAIDLAFDTMKDIDDRMSVYNNGSEVAQINRLAGRSNAKVSNDTLNVIEKALYYSKISDGMFDITVGPLMDIWGFRTGKNHIPSDSEISKALSLIDYRKVKIDRSGSTVELISTGMKMDIGAIAVGYAVDKAINVLKDNGIKKALVNGGGEIYALGSPPGKDTWRIGIQHPRRSNALLGTIELKDLAVSTSGDYENYFEVNGKRYCHIMNPKTGKSVEEIMSVTVVAETTTEADALSTVLFIMGAKEGMKLAEKLDNIECIIVTGSSEKDMKVLVSSGLKDKVKLNLKIENCKMEVN
jgi:FAD:protein FMN transferase